MVAFVGTSIVPISLKPLLEACAENGAKYKRERLSKWFHLGSLFSPIIDFKFYDAYYRDSSPNHAIEAIPYKLFPSMFKHVDAYPNFYKLSQMFSIISNHEPTSVFHQYVFKGHMGCKTSVVELCYPTHCCNEIPSSL